MPPETHANQKTLTASLSMTYVLGEKLTAILHYQFINVDSALSAVPTSAIRLRSA